MEGNYFKILWWFCHTMTWISFGCTFVPIPWTPLQPPSPKLPSGLAQSISFECPSSGIRLTLFMYFTYGNRRLYTQTSLDIQHWNQSDYILCSQRWRSSIQSAKTRPGACGSDHELLIAKFRLKLKKVGKITRSFRYDLNQIPYDYTVEVEK